MSTAAGEGILGWLDAAISAAQAKAEQTAGLGTCPSWGHCTPDCHHPDGIGTNDSESVLRRCTADRKLLELHQGVPDHGRFSEPECPDDCDGQHDGPPVCMACRSYAGDPLEAPCATVLILAEGYGVWTEDKRQSWRSLRPYGWTGGDR